MRVSLFIILLGFLFSCATTQESIVVSDRYDEGADATILTLIPYGTIEIPGEWTKTKYNEISRQHFFMNKDSVLIAVTKNPKAKYPFYTDSISDKEFAVDFYEWEKDHYEQQDYNISEKSIGNNFVIWDATGKGANTVFLYGAKNQYAYNFAVFTEHWTEDKRIEFLINLFGSN
jgi:hypothetical protein